MAASNQPIVIKKIIEEGGGGHHGGAWKVAYADFMTAMMAFFLLLWILAASDEEKLRGLADYFTPSLSDSGGRGDGLLDGNVLGPDGVMSGTDGPHSPVRLPSFGQENPLAVFDSRLRDEQPQVIVEYETRPDGVKTDTTAGSGEAEITPDSRPSRPPADPVADAAEQAELERAQEERDAELDRLEDQIKQQVAGDSRLHDFTENLRFDRTPEGLDIQIVDKDGRSMFDTGSSRIEERTRQLLRIVGEAILDMEHTLTVSGHTDSVPYSKSGGYSNWELSADRANATRRVLTDTGVNPSRFTRISGLADTAPLDPEHPDAAENRRISVTINYPEPTLSKMR
ncbi:chemotaxis protein MotB [Oceanicola sp. 22II-s10i]|uniref:flagellar motor protein MotB n=1 Tax=Oceanicola sp. 22II-s10i TaxID=1317116 RepID=UPI000B51E858|nr:flagellar motor protein MotB [Oceanicola sp. 22II-s10i]OWU83180.1 chemotaxis protein MotB [Oceanicola sp. 22II-s10i]